MTGPLPFPDAVLVGINEVKGKAIKVVDWSLVSTQRESFGLVKLICEGRTVKIKATNPLMILVLKQATGPFDSGIDDGRAGDLVFVNDKARLSKAARRRWG